MPALPVHLRLFSSVNTCFLLFGGGGSATQKEKISAFLLRCDRLALSFHKIGGGSATLKEKLSAFLLRCARLALSLHKTGGGSATQKENLPAFLLRCARLALSFHTKIICAVLVYNGYFYFVFIYSLSQ